MKKHIFPIIGFSLSLLASCGDFLEKKPDIKMTVPSTIGDATLLLNDYVIMNTGYPLWGEIGIDDYYVVKSKWESSNVDQRSAYIWADQPYIDVLQWQRPYKAVYYANQVIDILSKVNPKQNPIDFNRNLGAAHFFRAFAFQMLVEVHCVAYQPNTAGSEMGIPLRLEPGMDEKSPRATLQQSYAQIVSDFNRAIKYLPIIEGVKGRPAKAAAYAGMSRAFLNMGDYERAYNYADSCIQLAPELLDYNTLRGADALPIPKFNIEVLFPAMSANLGIMGATNALMDGDLYNTYNNNDLRKQMFFKSNVNPQNTYFFKGSYDKSAAQLFMGITTSEVYLIRAESACRIGKAKEALLSLNRLLKHRWNKNVQYADITEMDAANLLKIILEERRKELIFRGRRWSDLKRLNLDAKQQKNIVRKWDNEIYSLSPNDLIYAFRLSETVTRVAEIPQNKR